MTSATWSSGASAADPERPLTAKGVADVKKVASFLQPLGLRVEAVWHSGLTRARETADLLAAGFAGSPAVSEHAGLVPRDPAGRILQELTAVKKSVVIVGHRPVACCRGGGAACGRSTQQPDRCGGGSGRLPRAGRRGGWRLRWMITPGLLRRGQGR